MRAHAYVGTDRRARGRNGRPVASVGRWMMLLVALAGLVAMHGLSGHGVAGPMAASQMPEVMAADMAVGTNVRAAAIDLPRADAHVTLAPGASTSADGTEVISRDMRSDAGAQHGGAGGHGAMWAGMCLAVMGAVLLGAVGVLWRRPLYSLRSLFGDLGRARATALVACSHGPAPPDLRLLSIQRC